jgi:hypothetical protein
MADPNELLARADAEEAAEVAAMEQRASPFSALYALRGELPAARDLGRRAMQDPRGATAPV